MSGERHLTLHGGDVRAVVCTRGAALVGLEVAGVPVVSAGGEVPCPLAEYRGSILAPWPGRVADGSYAHDGRRYVLECNDPATGAALHGLAAHRLWAVELEACERATLVLTLGGDPGYPFAVALRATYALRESGITCVLTATNDHPTAVPVGLGAHPYLTAGVAVDDTAIEVRAGTVLALDERGRPAPARVGLPEGAIGSAQLDHALTDLERDAKGWAGITLRAAHGGPGVAVGLGPTVRWAMLYTSDTLPPPALRAAIAVEPMTCPPGALRSGRDLVHLEPGESLDLAWTIDRCP